MALNPQLFCQQIDKKSAKKYELLNMFFHRCSYKKSCFSESEYNSSVFVLMRKCLLHKDVLKDPALDLVDSFEGLLYFVYNFG